MGNVRIANMENHRIPDGNGIVRITKLLKIPMKLKNVECTVLEVPEVADVF